MELKVLTLNCWAIPIISKNRKTRILAIAEYLSESSYDFVCLQEIWSTSDFDLIKKKVTESLPYSHYFHSGVVGSGLCLFSKHPIYDVFFHQWSVNGYIHKIQHGDWFGGKGVGLCRFIVNQLNVNVYCAHLHAEYSTTFDEYQAHRVLQAYDTAQFIKMTSGSADLIILAGDLNTEPGSISYRILTEKADLRDCFKERIKDNSCDLNGTNEWYENSYTSTSLLKKNKMGKRIDYVMFTCSKQVNIISVDYSHPLPNRVPGSSFSYSDHEAVCASLKVEKCSGEPQTTPQDSNKDKEIVLLESIKIFDTSLNRLKSRSRYYWLASMFLLCVVITTIATDPPFGYVVLYHIFRVILTALLFFTVSMACLWCKIEMNAILAVKIAMEISLAHMTENNRL